LAVELDIPDARSGILREPDFTRGSVDVELVGRRVGTCDRE